jgi:glc operon protein GlcG
MAGDRDTGIARHEFEGVDMRYGLILGGLIGAALLGPGMAQAQQANPLDNVPEKMPYNIPYGAPISLDEAKQVIAAAEAEAKTRGWPVNITVVDSGSNLVAFERMDDAQLTSIEVSQHKARTAARSRRETKIFETAIQSGFNYILTLDGIIASRGGIPLIKDGKLIGAIGCSGATGSQDEVVCKAGAAVINK